MYTVFVVDDDVAVLEFLSKMIPWEKYGFHLVGAYTNAHDALEMSKELTPDLVVTDIGMPGMDGIEFIKVLKDCNSHPRFLILSCHDEFKFAQQAVQLGVQDYILKETLSMETMQDILLRIYDRINEEDRLLQKVEKLHLQVVQSKSSLKEKWLRDFLSAPLMDQAMWKQQLEEYGLKSDLDYFIPIVCSVYHFQDALARFKNENMLKFIIDNAVEELLQQEPHAVYFSYTAQQFFILFACRKDLKFDPYDLINRFCRELQQSLTKVLKLQVSILIGVMDNDSSGIKRQFLQLIQATDAFFYSTEPEIIKLNQIQAQGNHEELLAHYSTYSERMNRLIIEGNMNVEPTVDLFLDFITARRFQPVSVKQFLFKLMLDIQMKLTFNHQYNNEKTQRQLDQMTNVRELKEWIIRFLEEAVTLMEQISKQSKKVEIVDAKKYILLNLDQKITLEDVAERLFLNSSYFSRLFKKETGENFTEYVTRVKMEKAKELLNESDKTIDVISQMLGYDNKGYFVKLFKNHYGVPPRRFV